MAQNCDQESEIIFSDRQVIYSFPSFLSSRKYGDHVLSLSQHLYSFGKNQLLSLNEPRFKLETGDFYSSRFKAIETNKNLVLKFNMNNGKYFEPYRTFSKNLNLKKTKKFGDFKESIQLAKDLKFTLEKDHLKLNGSSIKKVFVGHGIQRVSENSFLFSGKESSSFSLYLVEQIKKRTKIKKIIGSDGGFFPFFNKNENKIFYSCNLNTSVALCALPAVGGQREVLLQSKGGVFKPIVYKGIAYFKSYHKEGFILSKASLGKKSTILPQKAFLGKMPNSEISLILNSLQHFCFSIHNKWPTFCNLFTNWFARY